MDEKSFELIEKLYIEMQGMRSEMQTGFIQVDRELQNVRQDIVRIENNHGSKLDALFDGYKANTEAIQDIKCEVQALKKEVETHEVKLKIVK